MKARDGLHIGVSRLLSSLKGAEKMRFSFGPDLRVKRPFWLSFVEKYPLKPGRVFSAVVGCGSVLNILRSRGGAKIGPLVVDPVAVNMVNFPLRPRTCHVEMSKSVSIKKLAVNADFSVVNAALHSFDASGLTFAGFDALWRLDPMKFARFGVVSHQVQQSFVCEHRA